MPKIEHDNRGLEVTEVHLKFTRDEVWDFLHEFFENALEEGNDVQERELEQFERHYQRIVKVFQYDGER